MKYRNLLAEMARTQETQSTLACLLGISVSSISRRFSGEVPWTIDEIKVVCEHYHKSYDELFS